MSRALVAMATLALALGAWDTAERYLHGQAGALAMQIDRALGGGISDGPPAG